jgi:hypothetical protein
MLAYFIYFPSKKKAKQKSNYANKNFIYMKKNNHQVVRLYHLRGCSAARV